MSDRDDGVQVILDTHDVQVTLDTDGDDPWEESDDPGVKQKITEIIQMFPRGGFQVAYVSPFAGHVLGNAIQPPIIRAELIQDSLLRLGNIPDSILREIAQLREDLWRVGQSYRVRENFEKDVDR